MTNNSGWSVKPVTNRIKQVHVEHSVPLHISEDELVHIESGIKYKLAQDLANAIFEDDLLNIVQDHRIETYTKNFRAMIHVVEPNTQYANLMQNVFEVNGETFTNDELIEAVKNYYAERLI